MQDAAITIAKIADLAVDVAKIADAAITDAKIKSLTWDKAQGGTALLGGLNNVNGRLLVYNSDGESSPTLGRVALATEV